MAAHRRPAIAVTILALSSVTLVALAEASGNTAPPPDPLAAELDHWSSFLEKNTATDDTWKQVKERSAPILEKAEQALGDGRRLLALERLAVVRTNLAACEYMSRVPKDKASDMAALEAEWKRMGGPLGSGQAVPPRGALSGAPFALARGEGEAARNQVHGFYASSLDYARATDADAGYFYLGAAVGQRQFAELCRKLRAPAALPAPPVRSIAAEIDALNRDLLRAYDPPASIERHKEFIVASSLIKEARELDANGLAYGALLRYLEAALRVIPLRAAPAPLDAAPLAARVSASVRSPVAVRKPHVVPATPMTKAAVTSVAATTRPRLRRTNFRAR